MTSGSADLEAGANVSLVAHLDADGTPTLGVFANDTSNLDAGQARITVRHTAAAPAVDIRRLLPSAEDAEDLVQQVFVTAWRQ